VASRKKFEPLLYLFPALVFLVVFILVPVVFLFVLSFCDWDMISGSSSFVGFSNYVSMFKSGEFHNAVKNTVIYVLGVVPVGMAISLLIAVILDQKLRLVPFYRTSIFLPVILSLAATGIIWLWIYDYENGILNHLLKNCGIGRVDWLGKPELALYSVILVTLWKRIGYNMVIFFAGLQVIPDELYEAAKIDGAGKLAQFKYVTWPNLLPATSFVLVINLIFAFRDFAQIYVMTRGGPMGQTTTLVYYIYETAFGEFDMGGAAAASMILFAVVLLLTYIKINFLSSEEAKA